MFTSDTPGPTPVPCPVRAHMHTCMQTPILRFHLQNHLPGLWNTLHRKHDPVTLSPTTDVANYVGTHISHFSLLSSDCLCVPHTDICPVCPVNVYVSVG